MGDRERRTIRLAKGAAADQLRQLIEESMHTGECQRMSAEWRLVTMRNPALYAEYLDEQGKDAPAEEEETPVNAADDLLQKARRLYDAGDYPTLDKAMEAVSKAHPALYRTYMQQGLRKAWDPGQQPPWGAVPEQLAPPARTAGHIAYDKLCERIKQQHPDWGEMEVHAEALRRDEGKAAWAQHGEEMGQRIRGRG
jgi:hypothetical protein